MALQGAIAGPSPGKKIVTGTVVVTTTNTVDLSALLQSVDSWQLTYQTQQELTNGLVSATLSGLILTVTCRETDATAGTTAATIHYLAVGDAPR